MENLMKKIVTNIESLIHYALNLLGLNDLLPRFTALMTIFAILIPTLFIIPFPKVSAAKIVQSPMSEVQSPEAFTVESYQQISDFRSSLMEFMKSQVLAFNDFKPLNSLPSETSLNATNATNSTNAFDFDGDGKADLGRFQKSSGEWKVRNSSNNAITLETLGNATSLIAPGKFDSDSITDYAVFSNSASGTWTIKRSSDSTTQTITGFGQAGDKPTIGDFDGDSLADLAVYRPSNATWYIKQSSTNTVVSTQFGASGDIPVQGNYDGDSQTDIAVFRPTTGDWHVLKSSSGYVGFHWGISTDVPVPADFDGDGKTDFAVFRGTTGTWYATKSSTNNVDYFAQSWGNYGDQPAPADFDGDGKADFTVWRPTTGVWHSVKSSDLTYTYKTLGIAGDIAVESAYIKQIGSTVSAYELSKARLLPINESGGTSLYSRNVGWGTGLAGLSGRGLSAGFGISYNSLIWTKQANSNGSSLVFDADNSNVSPGFRFGFPVIEPSYFDATTGKFAFLMVSPNGSRTEFRQIGATNTYETADSSYTQLTFKGSNTPNNVENLNITVIGTDGTTSKYSWNSGAYRCKEVKDANGNFITINHDETGLLRTVTDTLSRVITVNYDSQFYPTTITQNWQNGLHTYATLSYKNETINTNFDPNLAVFGPPNGTSLKVLDKIQFADNSSVRFDYNNYGQVQQVNNHAADQHKLNHTRTNLDAISGVQTDCPRFTETKNYVENFNNGAETTVANSFTTNQTYTLPDGGTATGNLIEVAFTGDPHNRISKTFTGNSGWKEGLPIKTEDFVNNVQKRWTWTDYGNSDTLVRLNPRVIESKVGDTENGNIRKTTLSYSTIYNLPSETKVFDNDQTTVLKRSVNYYNLDPVYTNRRIIGLPSKTEQYGLSSQSSLLSLVSKTTYAYDEGNFSDTSLEQNIAPIQHDSTNFAANFIIGRGNVTSVTRWNTEFPDDTTQAQKSSVKYNTAGSPVASIDVMGRTIKTSYADNWNAGGSPANTYAYPTKLTDPSGNFSQVKYRYDIGANVWAKSPTIDGNAADSGKETTREFDIIGRPIKETLVNTGAYSRYEYLTNQIQSMVYTTITDADNNGIIDTSDEVLSESWSDGAGRTRMQRSEHPNSIGGFSGTITEYDILGQVKRTTVPTELNANWEATGDDAGHPNFLWTSQEFDWKGRVTKEINTDNTFKTITYNGCGCAGGQVTTIEGEQLAEGRRTQKIYQDILGRTFKSETLNWNGSVYSTNLTTFNGSDQALSVIQQDNSVSPVVSQTTTMTYDGLGRMKTQHVPQQDVGTNKVYSYNIDDSIATISDARGAITNNAYNNLGLLEQVTHSIPNGSDMPETPTATFNYNNLGMRTLMTDGLGSVNYSYNNLGQLTSETRGFNSSLTDAPQSPNGFTMSYSYNLGGSLKNITYPNQLVINYGLDKAGKLETVSGINEGQPISIITNADYRAWGGLKKVEFGSVALETNTIAEITYNNRLFPDTEKYTGRTMSDGVLHRQVAVNNKYNYYADGRLNLIEDKSNVSTIPVYDRSHQYDQTGRLIAERNGKEALGTAVSGVDLIKYRYDFTFDAFNNKKTEQVVKLSLGGSGLIRHYNYVNNRFVSGFTGTSQDPLPLWEYDSDGRPIVSHENKKFNSTYNAAGLLVKQEVNKAALTNKTTQNSWYDGDGKLIKSKDVGIYHEDGGDHSESTTRYVINSTVLGKALVFQNNQDDRYPTAINKDIESYIYGLGDEIAVQTKQEYVANVPNNTLTAIVFKYKTVFEANRIESEQSTQPHNGETKISSISTRGLDLQSTRPNNTNSRGDGDLKSLFVAGFNEFLVGGCTLDGVFANCRGSAGNYGMKLNGGNESTVRCPADDCGPRTVRDKHGNYSLTSPFRANGDGTSGFYVYSKYTFDATLAPGYKPGDDPIGIGSSTTLVQGDGDGFFSAICYEFLLKVESNKSNPIAQGNRDAAIRAILWTSQSSELSLNQAAYAFATAEHETNSYTQLREEKESSSLSPKPKTGFLSNYNGWVAWRKDQREYYSNEYNGRLGNVDGTNDGYTFRGGGYVQLTGRGNYAKFGLDENNIDEVVDPLRAAGILVSGLMNGTFAGPKLSSFVNSNKTDFAGARAVVNSKDPQTRIVDFANKYLKALRACTK